MHLDLNKANQAALHSPTGSGKFQLIILFSLFIRTIWGLLLYYSISLHHHLSLLKSTWWQMKRILVAAEPGDDGMASEADGNDEGLCNTKKTATSIFRCPLLGALQSCQHDLAKLRFSRINQFTMHEAMHIRFAHKLEAFTPRNRS